LGQSIRPILVICLIIITAVSAFLGKYVEPTGVKPKRLDAEEFTVAPNPAEPRERVHVQVKLTDEARYVSLRCGKEEIKLTNTKVNVWKGEFAAPGGTGRHELVLLVTDYGDRDYVIKSTEWFLDVL
jgi:hypothetical protein